MRYIPFIALIALQTHFAYSQSIYATYAPSAEIDSTVEFFSVVDQQFHLIEDLRYRQKNTEQLKDAVDSIPRLINTWKHTIMNIKDTLDFNLLTIIKSADKTFCIVSWNTRLGDSKIDYASVILYKIKDSIHLQQQKQEFIKNKPENPKIRYNAIYTIATKDKKIFLAKGYGQGLTTEPWQEMKTFCIQDNSLTQPNILPHKKNRAFVAVNSIELRGAKKIPPLAFNSSKLILTIPLTNKDKIFTGSYASYHFNSKKFTVIRDKEVCYAITPY